MYRIEFKKENLEAQDEEIGRVVLEDGKVKGTLYGEGTKFGTKSLAEGAAKKFEDIFKPWPDLYKVTTDVYRVRT